MSDSGNRLPGYVEYKLQRFLEVGPEAYREDDALDMPGIDWSEQTISLLQSAARQLLDGAGLTVERPLEGLDIPTAYRLMDLVHFRRVRQAIAGKDATTFTDRMECAHIMSDFQLVFYNRVCRPAIEDDA